MIEVLLAALGLILFFIFLTLSLKVRLLLVLVCSVPQLYLVQLGGADVPLAFLLPALLLPEFLKNANRFLAKPAILSLIGLICISTMSLAWSEDKSMGIRDIAYLIEFIVIANAVYVLGITNKWALYKVINAMLFVICLQAVTVIIFRLNETLELSIVLSPVSKYLMGMNTLQGLLDGARNNFYDPVKAGGVLFVNANAAACYAGVSSFMAWGIYKALNSKFTLLMAILLWVTVFFTGSKAGVLFAVLIPMFIFYLKLQRQTKIVVGSVGASFAIALIAISMISSVAEQSGFLQESTNTAETRYEIWNYAFNAFLNNPLMGQGFGGWEIDYRKHTDYFLPPHNTLIYLWSKSGIIASLMGLSFILTSIAVALRAVKNINPEAKNLGFSLLMVLAWQFAHGFGENFGLIGEQHQMIIMAVMLGLCMTGNISMARESKGQQ
ncbi:O-antigen ligase family protein [Enterobacter asburiae]|jgi:O-antigen ligase|uniref:O-antigen ligase family protein n=1 Tax=Enterobacter asburiae TaxID=61645 RepID=UPI0028896231|nr:O-antigen ligase family protein [Enterobacter asburiae]WNI62825.1 O-antigen ligase family protein [Enterobacter asburiae]WNI68943.1 O-antigen ligase family protein [Enterobacter asburiae]